MGKDRGVISCDAVAVMVLLGLLPGIAQENATCPKPACVQSTHTVADAVAHELAEHVAFGANVEVTASQPVVSAHGGFQSIVISVTDNRHTTQLPLFVSSSGSYIVAGDLYDLGSEPATTIAEDVRGHCAVPARHMLTVTPRGPSPLPALDVYTVSAANEDIERNFLLLHDARTLIVGPLTVVGNRYNRIIDKAITGRTGPEDGEKSAP